MRQRLARLIAGVTISLILLPGSVRAVAPGEEAYDAVLIEERMEIDIRSLTDARVSYLNRTKVLTPLGAEDYAWADVFYAPGVEIKKLTGGIRTPEGKWIGIRKSSIHDAAAFASFELYSDTRRRTITLPGARPGSTIEYEYELRVSNLQRLENVFRLQEEIPVRRKTLILRTPADFPLRVSVRGKPKHSERVEDRTLIRTWSVSDVPALMREPHQPPLDDLLPAVTIEPTKIVWGDREIDTARWDGIAAFYLDLAKSRMDPTPAVRAKAKEITSGATTREEAIRRIFDFVQTNVNYVAVSLDIGGYQPHDSGAVLEHLYGDCKDKVTLTIAMLESVGIRALPVLILTRDIGTLDRDHPMLRFNHAIVALPRGSGYVYEDPTAESVPFGDLPWEDQGASALVVLPDGRGEFVETPLEEPSGNHRKIILEGKVNASGDLEGDIEIEARGQFRVPLFQIAKNRARKVEDRLISLLSRMVPGATVESPRLETPQGAGDTVRLSARVRIAHYLSSAGSIRVLPLTPVRLPLLTTVASRTERSLPIFFDFLFSEEVETRLWLPGDLEVEELPADASAAGPALETTTRYAVEEDGGRKALVTRRSVSVGRREYSPEEYGAFHDFVAALQAEDARAVTLDRGP